MAGRAPIGLSAGRYACAVFIALLLAYAYVLPRWADWNQDARFDLTRALVEHRTVVIDQYIANTGDYAIVNGRMVSEKAPGLSLLAIPPYAAFRLVSHWSPVSRGIDHLAHGQAFAATLNPSGTGFAGDKAEIALALTFVTLLCVAVPTALLGVLLAALFGRFSPYKGVNALVAIGLMLVTPLTAYGNAFYGHALAAALLFAAFAVVLRAGEMLDRPQLLALGLLFGAAVLVEYPAVLVVAGLGCWVLVLLVRQRMLRGIGWLATGGSPFFVLFVAYNHAAYGTFLPTGYEHSANWPGQYSDGFFTLKYPKPGALWELTFSDFRGLFFLAPVLLLAVPGFILWWKKGQDRAAWWVCLWSIAAMLLFNASSAVWWGGFSVGPRYLLPMVPFCIYPIGILIPALVRQWQIATAVGALMLVSGALVWAELLAGQSYPPDTFHHPFAEYVWPRLSAEDVARNAGMVVGLHGVWSLGPLVAILLALAAWTVWHQRDRIERSTKGVEAEVHYVRP